ADRTDWAISHSGSPLLQSTTLTYRGGLTRAAPRPPAPVAVHPPGTPPRGGRCLPGGTAPPRRQSLSIAAATRRGVGRRVIGGLQSSWIQPSGDQADDQASQAVRLPPIGMVPRRSA